MAYLLKTVLTRVLIVVIPCALFGCRGPVYDSGPVPEFPWPPPQASAMTLIEFTDQEAGKVVSLGDVDAAISEALIVAGYFERSYYAVPNGFALVTRLEQINSDGTSKSEDIRWAVDVGPLRSFNLSEYLRALFTSDPGYFRIIVFIVTPHPFSQAEATIDREGALDWLYSGVNRLPDELAVRPYNEQYSTTALIYEFEKIAGETTSSTKVPGRLSAGTHLEKSGLKQ